jgi:hypothetical protein
MRVLINNNNSDGSGYSSSTSPMKCEIQVQQRGMHLQGLMKNTGRVLIHSGEY